MEKTQCPCLSACLSVCLRLSLTGREPDFPFLLCRLSPCGFLLQSRTACRSLCLRFSISCSRFNLFSSTVMVHSLGRREIKIKCMLNVGLVGVWACVRVCGRGRREGVKTEQIVQRQNGNVCRYIERGDKKGGKVWTNGKRKSRWWRIQWWYWFPVEPNDVGEKVNF